jgi:hypothetical protein
MTDERFTHNELWILRAGIEALMDYQRENQFRRGMQETSKSLWLKILRLIDDDKPVVENEE